MYEKIPVGCGPVTKNTVRTDLKAYLRFVPRFDMSRGTFVPEPNSILFSSPDGRDIRIPLGRLERALAADLGRISGKTRLPSSLAQDSPSSLAFSCSLSVDASLPSSSSPSELSSSSMTGVFLPPAPAKFFVLKVLKQYFKK
jgi:hypothetical protein